MKKILFSVICLMLTMTVQAQTQFRQITLKEATAAAKAEQKLVFIDFYTTWCGPCKWMANEIFPQQAVGQLMNCRFVALKIDAEKGEGIELARKYNIEAYPTFVIVDANLQEVARTEGARDADSFIRDIERLLDSKAKQHTANQKEKTS